MFAGRATVGSAGKGGKFSVEDLYGFNKKPKVKKGNSGKLEWKKDPKEKQENRLASQILEAATKLMERRRLEIYLKECDVIMEQRDMPYR
ncbi:Lipoteichoic acid synthase [Dissostichus eleginoides]|uniref:Lipoteichoic acid synthase n=1 Tax=Dissostichus eleginoides TaxID=100907 RepID=A0AAD9ENJ2_DISEL|nr:Lipoteichoic acid synthase [Dissostichus eleginoides]